VSEGIPGLIKVLSKSMDSSLTSDKVELATVTRDEATGKVRAQLCTLTAASRNISIVDLLAQHVYLYICRLSGQNVACCRCCCRCCCCR
jgi:hypothetical protein